MVVRLFVGMLGMLLYVLLAGTVNAFQVGRRHLPVTIDVTVGARISRPTTPTTSRLFLPAYTSRVLLHARSELQNDGETTTKKLALATRIRKFFMALFRILMTPMRLFRSSKTAVIDTPIADTSVDDKVESKPVDVIEVQDEILQLEELKSIPSEELTTSSSEETKSSPPVVQVTDEPPLPVSVSATLTPMATSSDRPEGNRWAIASVDLSGDWIIMASDEFKEQYDEYLKRLGQPLIVRGIALGIIGLTSEYTKQTNEGRQLVIRGINARGVWERSLISSGADGSTATYEPIESPVVTADDEQVKAESWWEENGTVHISWMRGVTKYGGGAFESKRYLENDGKVLVCETVFHPLDEKREKAEVTWKFLRKGATL